MTKRNLLRHLEKLRKLSSLEDNTKGYAGDPQKFFDPFLPWFKTLTYKKGPYLVIDRYSGEELNIGQAITFYRRRPIYGVNYYGLLVDYGRKLGPRVVFDFLKKALRAGAGKSWHRGLDGFKENRDFCTEIGLQKREGFLRARRKFFMEIG
jgi:hypothetical protein